MKHLVVMNMAEDMVQEALDKEDTYKAVFRILKKIHSTRLDSDSAIYYIYVNSAPSTDSSSLLCDTCKLRPQDKNIFCHYSGCTDIIDTMKVSDGDDIEIVGMNTSVDILATSILIASFFQNNTVTVGSNCCLDLTSKDDHESALYHMSCLDISIDDNL